MQRIKSDVTVCLSLALEDPLRISIKGVSPEDFDAKECVQVGLIKRNQVKGLTSGGGHLKNHEALKGSPFKGRLFREILYCLHLDLSYSCI